MKSVLKSITFVLALWLLSANVCQAQIQLNEKTTIVFASADQGEKILSTRDDFIEHLSPFDRAARLKTAEDVTEEEFLAFVGRSTLSWNENEIASISAICARMQTSLSKLVVDLPQTIYLIKTNGSEEGNAAYTRGNAIVLPETEVTTNTAKLQKLIAHELFHVISRYNDDIREQLYASIGFQKCEEIKFPAELASRKITNPDAPKNDHAIQLLLEDKIVWAVPILFSNFEKYDAEKGGEFFEYLQFEFVIVGEGDVLLDVTKTYDNLNPLLVSFGDVSNFYEQVGKNTDYIIHPEEILADNFSFFLSGSRAVASPEILKKMDAILSNK